MVKRLRRKGNVNDVIFIIVMLSALMIGLVGFFPAWDNVITSLNSSSTINNVTKNDLAIQQVTIPRTINTMFVLVFFGSFISILAFAFIIRSNMMFFFIATIVIAVFAFVAANLANVYDSFVQSNPTYVTYVNNNFVLADFLIRNYVGFIIIMGLLVLLALYAKPSGSVGSGI